MHTDSIHVGNKRNDEDATCGQWIHGKLENIENIIRENMEAPGMESWQIRQHENTHNVSCVLHMGNVATQSSQNTIRMTHGRTENNLLHICFGWMSI